MTDSGAESKAQEAAVVETNEAAATVEKTLTASDSKDAAADSVAAAAAAAETSTVVDSMTAEPSDSPAATDDEQVSRISAAIARGRLALEEVRAKVSEYDEQYKASETAAAYLGAPIQKAQSAFDDLAATATSLKDKTVEIPTKALSRALTAANVALEHMTEVANKYDEKFGVRSKVRTVVSVPQEKCMTALVEVSNLAASVSAAANAQLQGVNHGICSRAASIASSGAGLVFSTAAALDDRFDIESKAINAGTAVVGKAQQLDERYNVKESMGSLANKGLERARGLDSRVTGGRVTPVVLSAFESGLAMAAGGFSFVQSGYESAKQQRQAKEDDPKRAEGEEGGNVTADNVASEESLKSCAATDTQVKESTSEAK